MCVLNLEGNKNMAYVIVFFYHLGKGENLGQSIWNDVFKFILD